MTIPLRRIAVISALVSLAFGVASVIGKAVELSEYDDIYRLVELVSVGKEGSLPTWLLTFLLLTCATVSAIIALNVRRRGESFVQAWFGLTILSALLSLNAATNVYDRLLRMAFAEAYLWYSWIVPTLTIIVILALVLRRFAAYLPALTCRGFLLASGLFVTGALGAALADGYLLNVLGYPQGMEHAMLRALEETLKSFGAITLLVTLLTYLQDMTVFVGALRAAPLHQNVITLSPRRMITVLVLTAMAFVVCSLGVRALESLPDFANRDPFLFSYLFDVDKEANFPTWYSSAALLLCAGLLALVASAAKTSRLHWWAMSGVFVLLSIDETVSLHERTMAPIYNILKVRGVIDSAIGEFLTYPWIILGAVFVLLFVIAYGRFLLRLPARTRWLFILGGALFVVGAMGMELVDSYFAQRYGHDNTFSHLSGILEESLEMFGVIIFAYGVLDYLRRNAADIQVRVAQTASDI
ncbi:MAG: hypothetical protein H7175_07960, partial [Burkholderiales bacterium]|nr:hypothetical protein [Anaerolineae bacterium]